jgi:ABC-2 family transporter protein
MVRLDLAPVFFCECRRLSRQGWLYGARSIVVAGLFAGLAAVWWQSASRMDLSQVSQIAQAGEWYFEVIVATQLSMVLLAVPAMAAGAFSTEMARGHVSLMLVTGLTPAEILLGTLCARLVPVLGTLCCVVPVLALASSMGGIPPDALVRLELVTAGTALLGCALALAASVATESLHEALMGTYVLLVGWVLGYPTLLMIQLTAVRRFIPAGSIGWFQEVNPYWVVLKPIFNPHSSAPGEEWSFLAGAFAVSMAVTFLAAWRLGPSTLGRLAGRARPSRRRSSFTRPTPSRNLLSADVQLVLWKETCFRRPSGWVGVLWGLYVAGAVLFSLLAIAECWTAGARRTAWPGLFNGFQAAVGLGLLSLVAPTALADERARGSLPVLLSTPISTIGVVLGKWLACFRLVLCLAVLPTSVAVAHVHPPERWLGVPLVAALVLAQGAAVTSLGIALATWIPRLDRALILSAAASVLMTVAWIPLAFFLLGGSNLSLGVASASPFLSVALLTSEMARASAGNWPVRVGWALSWALCYSGIALALLWATLATFDRCMGRSPADRDLITRPTAMKDTGAIVHGLALESPGDV